MRLSDFLQDIGRPVAFYPSLAFMCGSVNAALFLCQLIYWSGRERKNGQIYKSASEIEAETALSYKEQRSARRRLRELGILTDQYARLDHTTYFQINFDRVNELWEAYAQKADGHMLKGKMAKCPKGSSYNMYSETTSETTTEINNGCKSKGLASFALSLEDFLKKEKYYNQEAVEAIHYFLDAYEKNMEKAHPNLKPEQWQRHLETILSCTDEQDRAHDLTSTCLEEMVDKYFSIDTFWHDCDYSLGHFNTDGIKSRRMFELGSECL